MTITFSIYVTIKKWQFLQVVTGISANTFLLVFHISSRLDHRTRLTDMTICHLAFVHIIQLFTALLFSPELFESLNFQNELKCKVLFYIGRVMRSLSICTTSLLSVLQAITISPSTAWWGRLKHKCTDHILFSFIIMWFLSLSFSSSVIFYNVTSNVTQRNLLNSNQYCSIYPMSSIIRRLIFTLMLFRDISFIGIMLISSVYMMIFLSRHQRRYQHLHSTRFSPRFSPEKKASQTILLLVNFFVVIYWMDFIISSFSSLLWTYDFILLAIQTVVVNFYATVSPLVLISSDKRVITMLQKCVKLPSFSQIIHKIVI